MDLPWPAHQPVALSDPVIAHVQVEALPLYTVGRSPEIPVQHRVRTPLNPTGKHSIICQGVP